MEKTSHTLLWGLKPQSSHGTVLTIITVHLQIQYRTVLSPAAWYNEGGYDGLNRQAFKLPPESQVTNDTPLFSRYTAFLQIIVPDTQLMTTQMQMLNNISDVFLHKYMLLFISTQYCNLYAKRPKLFL